MVNCHFALDSVKDTINRIIKYYMKLPICHGSSMIICIDTHTSIEYRLRYKNTYSYLGVRKYTMNRARNVTMRFLFVIDVYNGI